MADSTKRYAVVTGGNRGIGLEICRQLAAKGVRVVLTARNEKSGLEALEKLRNTNELPHHLLFFHQLNVADPVSVAALADYLKTQFGKIDILVNNAGVIGQAVSEQDVPKILGAAKTESLENVIVVWGKVSTQSLEIAKECIEINYYGAKRMCEALIPLLDLSDSPRIVNVSSGAGILEAIPNEEIRQTLRDENLTEERVDSLLDDFLKDFEEGCLGSKGWPEMFSAYKASKAAMNAYTRILAKKHPNFCINCVCPGFVKTDINFNVGVLTVEQGAATPVKLALLPNGGPTGLFFLKGEAASF